MKHALIIGGTNGIGLSVALQISNICDLVTIVDRKEPSLQLPQNIEFRNEDLLLTDFSWLSQYDDVDCLFYSAGFGRVAHFNDLHPKEIENLIKVNTMGYFRILNYFSPKLYSSTPFYCGVMVSIAGRIASPLFSVYSASKAALFRGIEAINTELTVNKWPNRILEISPGSLQGTSFTGGPSDPNVNMALASAIVDSMLQRHTLLIPEYDTIFSKVIERYSQDPDKFAIDSYKYKIEGNRIQPQRQLTIGYLSGTFDLFHIGHLNLIKRARRHCDYLVVGLHKDGSHKGKTVFIPFEERKAILESLKYVDKVIQSEAEDSDVYTKGIVKYDKLFVGSDYKGTERFNRYENYFADKGVEIIYFPYTQGTSSSQLRAALEKK